MEIPLDKWYGSDYRREDAEKDTAGRDVEHPGLSGQPKVKTADEEPPGEQDQDWNCR